MFFKNLYLHIPFCKKKCKFCNFFSASLDTKTLKTKYTKAIINELDSYVHKIDTNGLETVYFGGGTPTELGIENLNLLIKKIKPFIKETTEITIELNPENLIYTDALLDMGFNRFSIGIQTFNKQQQEAIERDFDIAFTLQEIEKIRTCKAATLSLDFMFGLPGEALKDIENNINYIKQINPEHISYYMFTVHPNYQWQYKSPEENTIVDMLYYIRKSLIQIGYNHYEVSNYARDGYYSIHNTNYWQKGTYLGLGAGAHSFDGKTRWWNNKNLYKYNIGNFVENSELLTLNQHKIEEIMLGLRMLNIGFKTNLIQKKLSPEISKMLISYMSKSGEKFYRIKPEYLHLLDWLEKELA